MADRLRGALALVHPFPSALNAGLVLGLALLAGGSLPVAGGLAVAMLALQFSIGAANDVFDLEHDARSKPTKPLARGVVGRRTAVAVAAACAVAALSLAALYGVGVLALAALMLAAGLTYDAYLKRGPWAWLAFSVAFPALPVYAWFGASGALPPRLELLLPVAALAGPALQLSNSMVDLEGDRRAGLDTLAGRLGLHGSLRVMGVLLFTVHGLAWAMLLIGGGAGVPALVLVALASGLAVVGLSLSGRADASLRERGWQAQAASIATLAVGWLAATLGGPSG
jgi:4-hydroxybenzoate polyprenyltransferase